MTSQTTIYGEVFKEAMPILTSGCRYLVTNNIPLSYRTGQWRIESAPNRGSVPAGTRRKNGVVLTSLRRDDVASKLIRRHFATKCPQRYTHRTIFLPILPYEWQTCKSVKHVGRAASSDCCQQCCSFCLNTCQTDCNFYAKEKKNILILYANLPSQVSRSFHTSVFKSKALLCILYTYLMIINDAIIFHNASIMKFTFKKSCTKTAACLCSRLHKMLWSTGSQV